MTYQSDLFAGKRVLVTGGTRGIGAAVANHMAELGAEVLATARNTASTEVSSKVTVVAMDVSQPQAVESVFAGLDRLDVVVNCAGAIQRGKEHELDTFEQVVGINLTGTMRMCAAARPLLATSGGVIVNMASMLSYFGGPLVPAYSASKGAVAQLTKSLAIAYAAEGIRVNAVAPGWIATQFTKGVQDDPARNQAILDRTPMGRWGTPDDIAKVVVFLCTEAAGFVTGAIIPVDGGYLTV